jgi:hypothetical protein
MPDVGVEVGVCPGDAGVWPSDDWGLLGDGLADREGVAVRDGLGDRLGVGECVGV